MLPLSSWPSGLACPDMGSLCFAVIDWHDRAITDLDAAEIRGRIAELFERESMGDRPYSEWTRLWDERDTLKKEVRAALEMKRGQSAGPSRGRR